MATFQDSSVGFALETTYGTGVTPTRFLEFTDENLQYNKTIKQGQGLRVGGRVARSGRRTVPASDVSGDVTMECLSKGQGLWWNLLMGAGTSTLVSASTYQQLFTLADVMPSATVQVGRPRTDGTVDAFTFAGVICDSFDITFNQADIVSVKATLDGRSVTTATAYAAPSYATGGSLFTFAGCTLQTGTLTAPTSTALASGATPIANVRAGDIQVQHGLFKDRWLAGNGGLKSQSLTGLRTISGTLTAEYSTGTLRDAILNETPMSLVATWVTTTALSTGVETLQVVLPEIKLDGDLPTTNAGNLITHPVKFQGLDNLTAAQPIWVVTRTSDAAL